MNNSCPMLAPLLSPQETFEFMRIIQNSRRILLCAHRGPDGDAVGSCLGLAEYLTGLGKQVNIVLPNPFPDFLQWIPGTNTIIFYARQQERAKRIIRDADLIFCLDFNALSRLQEMGEAIAATKATRVIICLLYTSPSPRDS